jgi:serine/threonine protein kinase
MSFSSKLYILLNVVHGMMDLANLGISHLDIKPNNIILCKSFIPKIIDFG